MPLTSFSRSTAWTILWGILLACIVVGVSLWRIQRASRQNRFDTLILWAAGENGCDPALVKAVVWRESRFNPSARGKAGEFGLMQVMPQVGQEWATSRGDKNFKTEQLLDPAINLRAGSWYLSRGIQQWNQASEPVPLALAQYNAGRSNLLKWVDAGSLADGEYFISRIQFPSTRSYVSDILRQWKNYREHGEF